MRPIFAAKVEKGELVLAFESDFKKYLLTLEGRDVDVVVGAKRKPRSNNENRYYWGVVVKLLCESTGYLDYEMHDALRLLFLRDESRKIPTVRSTAALNTVEFEDYLSKIRGWASQTLNVYIPEPNEVEF